jgi:uncharacterized membrane protein YccC
MARAVAGQFPEMSVALRVTSALRSATPALLFGLRLWAAVSLALYVAFWLELDNAQWAGASAAIVCQPSLGASLRKGAFRMVGTVIGAVAIVVLTACFPQDRTGFLLGLALWGAVCGLVATLLRNSTAYAAALAGYTAAIIASDLLGATGGASDAVFMLAVDRASEICIGIVCAGIVIAGTDLGGARRRLAAQFAALSAEITGRLAGTFLLPGPDPAATRTVRRGLVARVVALGPIIDEAIGEASDLRYRARGLQAAVDGLFAALSGWRTVASCLERLPDEQGWREADAILRRLPQELRAAPVHGDAMIWAAEPSHLRRVCRAAVRALAALPAGTPSLRLMADATARALLAMSRALDALALLNDVPHAVSRRRAAWPRVPDLLPAFVNAARVFVTIGAVELFWVATAWPNGALAVAFAAIGVILLSPQEDRAYAGAKMFLSGLVLIAVLAGLVDFALLPGAQTFLGFSLAIGLVLVPVGALSTQPWRGPMFVAMTISFIPLLGPANQMTYNTLQFYNVMLAIVGGLAAAALGIVLLPPLAPALRVRRLLALTLRDLRRLAAGRISLATDDWEGRVYGRLTALPAVAEPLQLAWLVAALSVGTEIIRLRRIAPRLALAADVDTALDALATGDSAVAVQRLARIDRRLAALPGTGRGASIRLRARGGILAISEALTQHAIYFDGQVQR